MPTLREQGQTFSLPSLPVVSIPLAKRGQNTLGAAEFSYPISDCFTYTYKLKISNAANNMEVRDAFTATDGTTYLVGSAMNGGQKDGLLQQINHTGVVAWSKAIGRSDRTETINSIRQLTNGNLVLIGTSSASDYSDKKIFITEVDDSGIPQWTKSLSGLTGYEGIGISPTTSNGIGFAGHDDSTVVYGRLDFNGNLVWIKKMRLMEKGAVIGMTCYDYDSWYIAYSGIDSARHVAALVRTEFSDGAVSWINRFGGVAENADYIFHDHEAVNLRSKLVGIYSINKGPYQLFKITVYPTGLVESFQTFRLPDVVFDTSAQSSLTPWAEVIAFSPTDRDENVYAFKTINENSQDTLIQWRQKFTGIGRHQLATIERTFDGGFLITNNQFNPVTEKQEYILKTDSTGRIKNCEGEDFTLHNTMRFSVPVANINPAVTGLSTLLSSENITSSDHPTQSTYACKDLYCPPKPVEDSCINTFLRRYQSANVCELAQDLVADRLDEITVIGHSYNNPYGGAGTGFFAQFNGRGKLLTRKKINFGNSTFLSKIVRIQDGSLLVVGFSTYNESGNNQNTAYLTLSKFTPSLTLIWNRSFPVSGNHATAYGLLEDSDGSIFLNYFEGPGMCEKFSILKLNNQGALQWVKTYLPAGSCPSGLTGSMTQDEDYLYTIGYTSGHPGCVLMKINKATGNVVWSKGYDVQGLQTEIAQNLSLIGNNLVVQGMLSGSAEATQALVIIDKNGTLKRHQAFATPPLEMAVTRNQEIVLTGTSYPYTIFCRLDSNLKILNSKQTLVDLSFGRSIKEAPDGSIYETGFFWQHNAYIYPLSLKKYSYDGLLGSCFADTMALKTINLSIQVTPLTTTVSPASVVLESLPYQEYAFSLQENDLLCSAKSPCNSLSISGPTSVCDTLVHAIQTIRNQECHTPVIFEYPDAGFKVISRTDSSLKVQFVSSGSSKVKARIFIGCSWLEDSLTIVSSLSSGNVQLGPDTTLCPGNNLTLNARKGYLAYRWQDGSADSTFTVTQPGDYHVTVWDGCGQAMKDTVIVYAAPPIPFDIGADRIKCNKDTIRLQAPDGFLNYIWYNNYNINSLTAQEVIVNPDIDTAYYVKAEKTPGCFAYDTVRIRVHLSPPVNLGNDTSFCEGQTITLDAGSGFASYLWNTGATTQAVVVQQKGTYAVMGTTTQGCFSYDTLHVLQIYSNPKVQLNDSTTLCQGSTRILDPGSFAAYLWQDGSTNRTFSLHDQGIYGVAVRDDHNCQGRDTITITTILPSLQNFLPSDTAICSYGSLLLKPKGAFKSYLWSTGSTTSSLTIKQAATYYLQVVDRFGCTGSDKIIVNRKECMSGLYIPNAFTPNRDEKNDVFRALLFGEIKSFSFTIYNRWGEIVFQTTDRLKGWDGTCKGVPQNPGLFIWICNYQLEGESVKVEKGTVILIR